MTGSPPGARVVHPLFGIAARRWLGLVNRNGGVDPPYMGRGTFVTLTSLLTAPGRLLQHLRFAATVRRFTMAHPPVFIIGHWRSGTTYLHELLSYDPQFCHVSLWNTMLPDSFQALAPLKESLSRFLPGERPMDAIKVAMDGPYEDEAALAALCPWSFFHCLHFPRNAREQYDKAVHFTGLSTAERESWKERYTTFLKAVSVANGGKQLLSKNPPNTARVATLLEMFPNARFIFVYRSPYLVYLSTRKMRRNVLDKLALQSPDIADIDRQVLEQYIRLLGAYFDQRPLIPEGHLVEVRYETLVQDPVGEVSRIYTSLGLSGLAQALPLMQGYLDRQRDYKTNVYRIDKETIETVDRHWGALCTRWSYGPPSP